MTTQTSTIAANLKAIQDRMAAAALRAGREPDAVTLVAVTKAVGLAEVKALLDLGCTHLGENRVEVARAKIEALAGRPIQWHMVGNIQRRKARDVAELFSCADAIDRVSLAETLQRRCEEQDTFLDCLAEVNVSGEAVKHGFAPAELAPALRDMRPFDRLRVNGLMTMAPSGADEPALRRVFGGLRALAREHGLPECSMGMTNDYEIAIEEGATQVRIGRALYA